MEKKEKLKDRKRDGVGYTHKYTNKPHISTYVNPTKKRKRNRRRQYSKR